MQTALRLVKRSEVRFSELLNRLRNLEILHSSILKVKGLEFRFRLSSVFKNLDSDPLIELLVILNLFPVNLGVFAGGNVHDTKFSLVSNIG